MRKIVFARDWARIPEKTWSGTAWNLRNSLEKYYNIINVNLKAHCLRDYFAKIRLCKRDCSLANIKRNRNRFRNVNKIDLPIIQFDETFCRTNSYLFIDLCVDFLVKAAEQSSQFFKYSGFQKIPLENLK